MLRLLFRHRRLSIFLIFFSLTSQTENANSKKNDPLVKKYDDEQSVIQKIDKYTMHLTLRFDFLDEMKQINYEKKTEREIDDLQTFKFRFQMIFFPKCYSTVKSSIEKLENKLHTNGNFSDDDFEIVSALRKYTIISFDLDTGIQKYFKKRTLPRLSKKKIISSHKKQLSGFDILVDKPSSKLQRAFHVYLISIKKYFNILEEKIERLSSKKTFREFEYYNGFHHKHDTPESSISLEFSISSESPTHEEYISSPLIIPAEEFVEERKEISENIAKKNSENVAKKNGQNVAQKNNAHIAQKNNENIAQNNNEIDENIAEKNNKYQILDMLIAQKRICWPNKKKDNSFVLEQKRKFEKLSEQETEQKTTVDEKKTQSPPEKTDKIPLLSVQNQSPEDDSESLKQSFRKIYEICYKKHKMKWILFTFVLIILLIVKMIRDLFSK